jgi:hypothetical protein
MSHQSLQKADFNGSRAQRFEREREHFLSSPPPKPPSKGGGCPSCGGRGFTEEGDGYHLPRGTFYCDCPSGGELADEDADLESLEGTDPDWGEIPELQPITRKVRKLDPDVWGEFEEAA